MVSSIDSVLLSFLTGVVLACVYFLFRKICKVFPTKKFLEYFLDFTFVIVAFVLTFIITLAIDSGHTRLIQLIAQISGFSILVITLSCFKERYKS